MLPEDIKLINKFKFNVNGKITENLWKKNLDKLFKQFIDKNLKVKYVYLTSDLRFSGKI